MRNHLLLAVVVAPLLVAGTPALSQMVGGVGGGVGGSPQDARETERVFEELKDQRKISAPVRTEAPDELAVGADLVKQAQFAEAVPHLELALANNPNNSTTLIYLGFSHRMMGALLTFDARDSEYKKALGYYRQALAIDPDNKLLHEYLGKLYLLMRDQPSAENELKALQTLCRSGCQELDTRSKVMLDYTANIAPATSPPGK